MNNTLTDLKRLLDEGETICHGDTTIWKSTNEDYYFYDDNSRKSPLKIMWEEVVYFNILSSNWHQRDQLKPENPVMMAVPIEQWDALQEELKRLREQVK